MILQGEGWVWLLNDDICINCNMICLVMSANMKNRWQTTKYNARTWEQSSWPYLVFDYALLWFDIFLWDILNFINVDISLPKSIDTLTNHNHNDFNKRLNTLRNTISIIGLHSNFIDCVKIISPKIPISRNLKLFYTLMHMILMNF